MGFETACSTTWLTAVVLLAGAATWLGLEATVFFSLVAADAGCEAFVVPDAKDDDEEDDSVVDDVDDVDAEGVVW